MVGRLEVETRREEGEGVGEEGVGEEGEEAPLQGQVDKKGLKFSDRLYSNIIHACIDMALNTTQVLSSMETKWEYPIVLLMAFSYINDSTTHGCPTL